MSKPIKPVHRISIEEKLQKVLARAGLGSRRLMEEWIVAGRVTVNGKIAKLGGRVASHAAIAVDGHPIRLQHTGLPKRRILLYHKPEGEICTRSDPENRPTVFSRLPLLRNGRWVAVGRLDINTSGLLVFTNDGELAHQLMHPSFAVEREYAVRVLGKVDNAMLARLRKGVQLEDGFAKFEDIVDAGGVGVNHWYHVVVKEGRNREVRRLWKSQGVKVSRLLRVRFGPFALPRRLRSGQWQELEANEINTILLEISSSHLS